jgi:hypothetical protein
VRLNQYAVELLKQRTNQRSNTNMQNGRAVLKIFDTIAAPSFSTVLVTGKTKMLSQICFKACKGFQKPVVLVFFPGGATVNNVLGSTMFQAK